MRVALLTREYPPEVYGGAGVHVEYLARALAGLADVTVHCQGAPRDTAVAHQPWQELRDQVLRVFSADLSMADAVGDADIVHSHTWYAGLAGHLASLRYGIAHVVARIYDPRRAEIYQRLGIPTVATVAWTIEQVTRKLFPGRSVSEWTDPTGQVSLVERALPDSWCGRKLSAIEQQTGARIVAVVRGNQSVLPPAELLGQEGDVLYLAVDRSSGESLNECLGTAQLQAAER